MFMEGHSMKLQYSEQKSTQKSLYAHKEYIYVCAWCVSVCVCVCGGGGWRGNMGNNWYLHI